MLHAVIDLAKREKPLNCHGAGIGLLTEGEPTTSPINDQPAEDADLVQFTSSESRAWSPADLRGARPRCAAPRTRR